MRTKRNPQPFDALLGLVAFATALVVIGFAGAPSDAATEPVVPVEAAVLVLSDEPLLVTGLLVAAPDGMRLCEQADASGCLGASLCVRALDPHLAGRVRAGRAPLAIALHGAVSAGVLDLHAGSAEPLRRDGCELAGGPAGWGGAGDDVPRGGGGVPVLE